MARQPVVGRVLVIVEGFTITLRHTTHGRTLDLTTHTTRKRPKSILRDGFEPSVPARERPQTHALGRTATVIGEDGNSACENVRVKNDYIKYKGDVCIAKWEPAHY
jgi:hypothetical protein